MRKNIKSGIYCIENVINNKKYIGQSINIYDRWCKHKNKLKHNSHDNDYLQKAWNKYGEENFKFYILELCPVENLDLKEIYYIEIHNTLNSDYGYNLKAGGQDSPVGISEYSRKKLSDSLKRYYSSDDDTIEKRRTAALKQWSNPKIKEKIMGENNGMYGRNHTDESKRKMSEKKKGKPSKKRNMTPVHCQELDKTFECAAIAAQELSVCSGSILRVCRGKRKTCGGYHWAFLMENNIS